MELPLKENSKLIYTEYMGNIAVGSKALANIGFGGTAIGSGFLEHINVNKYKSQWEKDYEESLAKLGINNTNNIKNNIKNNKENTEKEYLLIIRLFMNIINGIRIIIWLFLGDKNDTRF